jgi:NAD(P)H-nitrite reductase large subunit
MRDMTRTANGWRKIVVAGVVAVQRAQSQLGKKYLRRQNRLSVLCYEIRVMVRTANSKERSKTSATSSIYVGQREEGFPVVLSLLEI